MKILKWIGCRLLSKFPAKEIGNGFGEVFFMRYTLLSTRFGEVFLHRFLRSDMDRCKHDHPWTFITIILRGGYYEEMEGGKFWRKPGSVLYRTAETSHRIEVGSHSPLPWSLVFVGPKRREWGFLTKDGWKPWRKGEPNPICETR